MVGFLNVVILYNPVHSLYSRRIGIIHSLDRALLTRWGVLIAAGLCHCPMSFETAAVTLP